MLILLICTAGFFLASLFEKNMMFAAVGMLALSIVAIPMLWQSRIDWFSPWSFVILSVALGGAARGICISLMWPDPTSIELMFLLGEDVEFFLFPWGIMLLGLVAMTVGYFGARGKSDQIRRWVGNLQWNEGRLKFVVAFVFVVSLGATIQYVRNTGGFSSGVISGKRTVISDVDISSDTEFNQFGYLRQMAKMANFAYLTVLGYALFHKRRIPVSHTVVLVFLFFGACALPFYTSSRLPIVWTFCGTGALLYYSGKEFALQRLMVVGLMGIIVYFGMSVIRGKKEAGAAIAESTGVERLAEGFVIHRNFFGITKTAHVINAVPELLDFQYGYTFGVWLVAPVPRAIWSTKPLIHSGPIIGNVVYGNTVSGVPPGLIGELYWNFGSAGVVLGCFAVGRLLRIMGDSFRPRHGKDLKLLLLYVTGPMRLGFEMLGNSAGFGCMVVAMDLATIGLLLFLATDYAPNKSTRGQRVAGRKVTSASSTDAGRPLAA
ncbi:MAG: oligosaccharide repeat unit polymerase [Planctomycetales bacterium]|nr:oligosaccharide repeat unit polymerase [Planctomycetales bacterium]